MANPRQRRKAKSNHKPVSRSNRSLRKMPTIRGPKALQDAWDKKKTVRQNYAALGLAHRLDPIPSGGSEMQVAKTEGATREIRKGFGKIVRDESGAVIEVELPEEEGGRGAIEDMEMLEAVVADVDQRVWAQGGTDTGNSVVKKLQGLAEAERCQRHTSSGERLYLARLVQKYGEDDYEGMARDRRLNPGQKTVGELKRAVAKAGGCPALIGQTDMSVPGPSLHKAKLRDLVTPDVVTPGA